MGTSSATTRASPSRRWQRGRQRPRPARGGRAVDELASALRRAAHGDRAEGRRAGRRVALAGGRRRRACTGAAPAGAIARAGSGYRHRRAPRRREDDAAAPTWVEPGRRGARGGDDRGAVDPVGRRERRRHASGFAGAWAKRGNGRHGDGRGGGAGARAARAAGAAFVLVDDGDRLDAGSKAALRAAAAKGARLAVVGSRVEVEELTACPCAVFEVPALGDEQANDLLRRSVPSLPEALRAHLVERTGGRPGMLRAAVRKLAGRAIVSEEDIDNALGRGEAPASVDRGRALETAERALSMGRLEEAARSLDAIAAPRDDAQRVRIGLARAADSHRVGGTRRAGSRSSRGSLTQQQRRTLAGGRFSVRARTCGRASTRRQRSSRAA